MKKMQTKRIIDVVMLIVLTALLFTMCMLFMPVTRTAEADGSMSTVSLSLDKTELLPGSTITLTLTFTTVRTDQNLNSASIRIITMTKDSGTTIDTIEVDTQASNYLTYDRSNPLTFVGDNAELFASKYNLICTNNLSNATSPYLTVGIAAKMASDLLPVNQTYQVAVPLQISSDLADDTSIDTYTFGAKPATASKVVYGMGTSVITDYANADLAISRVAAGVKIPSTDPTLSELKMGIGDELETVELKDTGMSYTITSKDLDDFTILPTSNDGATIKVGLTLPATTEAPSGEKTKLAITTSTTVVYIETLAEDGVTTKQYTVGIKIAYVALESLTVTSTPVSEGVTKNGLAKEFDPDTLAYDVYVPENATTTKMSAKILTGFDTYKSITLRGTNCTVSTSYQSGASPITIYSVKEGSVVTLTVKAPDGTTTKVYTLTFKKMSEDTSITTITVKGADTDKEYENDADKAKDENVDYFFVLDSETSEPAKGKFAITLPTGASAAINNGEYDEATEYDLGTYTVVITAAAGNTKTYKVTLSATLVLEFADSSDFEFILEDAIEEYGDWYYYRMTYEAKGWVHGKDDKDLEKYVIGNIIAGLTIREFLANFADTQQNAIKLYQADGTLVVDRGNPAPGFSEADLNDYELCTLGTGWYIEYGKGETPSETVYISILGDLNGDGYVDAPDSVQVMSYGEGYVELDLEFRLAGYLVNDGGITTQDAVSILSIGEGYTTIEDYMKNWKTND